MESGNRKQGRRQYLNRIRKIMPAVAAVSAALSAASAAHAATNGTWTNGAGGLWSTASNWSGGNVAAGSTGIADFSTLNLGANATVNLDSSRSIGQLKFADTTTAFFNWLLDNNGNAANILTLDNGGSQPIITVGTGTNATQIATMSGVIAGTNGFVKAGPSALLLTGNNTITGQITLNSTTSNTGSDLYIGSNNALGGLASNILFVDPGTANITRVRLNDGVNLPNNITLHNTRAPAGNGVLQTNGNVNATISGNITFDGPTSSGGAISGPNEIGVGTPAHFLTITGSITQSNQYPSGNLTNAQNNGLVIRTGNVILAGGGSYFRLSIATGYTKLGASDGIATNAYLDMGFNDGNPPGSVNATLDLAGFNQTVVGIGNISQSGTITNSANLPSILTLTPGISSGQPTPPSLTLNSPIQDSQASLSSSLLGVVVNGAPGAIQTFNGATSNYHGATTINGGILAVNNIGLGGANSSIGASSNAASNLVLGGGTLRYTGGSVSTDRDFTTTGAGSTIDVSTTATSLTMTGAGQGIGGLTKAGTGTLVLTGTHTYLGNTAVSAGTLLVNGSLATSSNVSIASSATLGGTGTIGGSVTPSSGGIIAPGGAGTVGTLTAGALTLNNGGEIDFEIGAGNDQMTIANAGGLTINGGNLFLYNTGAITAFNGTGTFTLFNINGGFSGTGANPLDNLTISNPVAGKFYNFANSPTSGIQLTIGLATTIEWSNTSGDNLWTTDGSGGNWNGSAFPNAIGQTAKFGTLTGGGTVDLNGNKTVSGLIFDSGSSYSLSGNNSTLTIDNGSAAGAITVFNGSHSIDVPVSLAGAISVMTTNSSNALTISGNITGPVPIALSDPGTITLTGTNSFTSIAVNASTLNVGNGGATGTLGSGNVTLANAAILNFNRNTSYNFGQNITGSGTVNQLGSGATTVGAVNVTAVNVSNGGLVTTSLAQTSGIHVTGSGSLTANGAVSGAGKLTVNTSGTVNLNAANNYAGGTQIDNGLVTLNAAGALPANSTLAVNGGTLDLNTRDISITNILDNGNLGGVITNSGASNTTSTINFTGSSAVFFPNAVGSFNMYAAINDGINGGKVALVSTISNGDNGTFSLALHASSNYSGGTTITRQCVDAYATNALGINPVMIQSNTSSTNVTHLGVAGGIMLPNDIVIVLPNAGLGNGAIQFLTTTSGSSTLTGTITLQADPQTGGTFVGPVSPFDFLNINGAVNTTGTATTVYVRSGNVGFGGGGTYPHLDNAGAIRVNATNGIAMNAVVNMAVPTQAAGTLDLHGFDQTMAGLIGGGGTVFNLTGTSTLTLSDSANHSYSGIVDSSINVVKSGSGTQTLGGANTYNGTTTAIGGRLSFTQSLTMSPAVSASGTGTIELANSAAGDHTIRTTTLSASGGGKIDLQNNKAIVSASSLAAITPLVATGRNGGTWDGPGIMTSRADADTLLTGIAVALNSDLSTPKSSFGDQNGINGSDVLLMYTYVGDADLTGSIDGDDYMRIDAGYSSGGALTGYVNGDFDYSGSINADDYWLIDRNYSRQFSTTLAPGPIPGGVAAVPEPASIGAIALAGCAMLARRQRR